MKRHILFSLIIFLSLSAQTFAQYINVDFESGGNGATWTWIMDQNADNPPLEIIANPVSGGINTTATLAKFTARVGGQPWALTYTDDIDEFQFDATNNTIKIMVYKPEISDVAVKFEGPSAPIEIKIANTLVNEWEEITYDFSGSIGNTYNRLVVIPDFQTRAQDNIVYFDNIQIPEGNIAPPTEPAIAAPTPTEDEVADNVFSIYSGAYTDLAGTDFDPDWGQSTVQSFEDIASDETNKYENLTYQGTQLSGGQDVSGHEFLHVDFWTSNSTALNFFLISLSSGEVAYALPITAEEWVSVDIPLTAFSDNGLTLTDIHQFKVDGNGTIWFDNWYFHGTNTPPPPPTEPTVAAPTPTEDEVADNVLSIYSGAYTDLAGTNFDPDWGQSTVQSFEVIAGDETNKYTDLNYQGTQFASSQDVSNHEFLHVDFWTANSTALNFFLISMTSGEVSYALPITTEEWVSVDIPLSAFSDNGLDLSDIHQFKVDGNGTIWFDNWYFYGDSTPPPSPATAAPTPVHDEVDNMVISVFSDSYTDIAGTDFNPDWGQNTVVTFEDIDMNNTMKYGGLDYQGTMLGSSQNISAMDSVHIDFWTSNSTDLGFFLISPGNEIEYLFTIVPDQWNSVNIPISAFVPPVDTTDVFQLKVDGNGDIWFDNIYFFAEESSPPPMDTDITFCVDLSCEDVIDSPSVYGTFNGWNTTSNPLTDTMGDSMYCTTIPLMAGDYEYKFFNNGAGENMTTPEDDACTVTNFGFTNRAITVVQGIEETATYAWESCDASCAPPPPMDTDITFCVDLSCEDAIGSPSVYGTFNGWNTTSNPLSDAGGDSIYCTTIPLMAGDYEYLFFNSTGETMTTPEDDACTITNFGFTNRAITVVEGMPETVTFGWESCDASCDPPPPPLAEPTVGAPDPSCDAADVISMFSNVYTDVTVDTWLTVWSDATLTDIQVAGNDTKKYENLNFAGVETVTAPIDASTMTHFNLDIWTPNMTSFKVKLVDFGADGAFGGGDDSEHELEFMNPNQEEWVSYEIAMTDFTALVETGHIAQLILSGSPVGSSVLYVDNVYFSDCAAPVTTDITLCVDLSCFDNVTAPSVFGAFNGWNAGANPITDPDGDSTYCATVALLPGDQEYKFFFQEEGAENMETPEDDACTLTTGGFTNRLITVVEGMEVTEIYGWETCDAECTIVPPPVTVDIEFCVDLSCFNSVTAPSVFGSFNGWNAGANPISDPDGDSTYCAIVALEPGDYEYKFFFQEEDAETLLTPEDDACTVTNSGFTNRAITVVEGMPETVTFGWETCDAECTPPPPPPPGPSTGAPDPTCDSAEVISMFSGVYTDVPVDTWLTVWSQATFEDIQVDGNDTKKYSDLNFAGIETVANQINAATMATFNLDFWTPDLTELRVKLVDFGADGAFGGGDDSEHEVIYATPALNEWITYEIQLSDMTGIASFEHISQLIISGNPSGSGTVYIDNVYFATCTSMPPPAEPTTGAPDPTCPAGDVISMFSNVYSDVPVDTWLTVWSSATLADVQVLGNDTKLYTNVDFFGVETVGPNLIDASGMTNINLDIWTPNMTTFRIKIVDFGADGAFGGGDDSEHEIEFNNPANNEWINYQIPLADFTGLTSTEHIAQLVISALPTGTGTVYIDNVFYSTCAPLPTEPQVDAPDPTNPAGDVISMFSGVYTDVPVDTWLTVWSNAALEDIQINGNDTKKYTNVVFFGVETTGPNLIDASEMDTLHLDIWTPDMTVFKVKLVDFGADQAFGGGDDTEHEITYDFPPLSEWISYDIPMSDFVNLASSENIAQLIISGDAPGFSFVPANLYLDNVYFSKQEALPIELLSFKATKVNNRTLLNWETASETNNDYFEVERSVNGSPFQSITRIKGAGNSTKVLSYEAWDNSPSIGTNYFRLKQVDLDGSYSYSDIVSVNYDSDRKFNLINHRIIGNNMQLNYDVVNEGTYNLMIVDISGRTIFRQEVILKEGINQVSFDTPHSGILMTVLSNGIEITTNKIFK